MLNQPATGGTVDTVYLQGSRRYIFVNSNKTGLNIRLVVEVKESLDR